MSRAPRTILCLLLLSSCATEKSIHSRLPADVAMNQEAGRGSDLLVTLRLEDGEELPFELDTGSAATYLDKSLEPKLVKRPYSEFSSDFGFVHQVDICAAPRLYLGNTPLMMTGTNVVISDFSQRDGRPIKGILGMNVLEHYCIQLDFKARRIRFLDDEHVNKKDWGRPLSLVDIGDGCFFVRDNLAGVKGPGSLIDTGCNYDGWLTSELYRQWTNQAMPPADGQARYPNGVLGGGAYPYVLHLHRLETELESSGDSHLTGNGVGLHFLARHLVTFDFPKRMMYLKRTSALPLVPEGSKPALKLLKDLKRKGRVPGWSRDDNGVTYLEAFSWPAPESVTFNLLKKGDSSIYHYSIAHASKDAPWKLQKAWRTDGHGRTIEEYPVAVEVK